MHLIFAASHWNHPDFNLHSGHGRRKTPKVAHSIFLPEPLNTGMWDRLQDVVPTRSPLDGLVFLQTGTRITVWTISFLIFISKIDRYQITAINPVMQKGAAGRPKLSLQIEGKPSFFFLFFSFFLKTNAIVSCKTFSKVFYQVLHLSNFWPLYHTNVSPVSWLYQCSQLLLLTFHICHKLPYAQNLTLGVIFHRNAPFFWI